MSVPHYLLEETIQEKLEKDLKYIKGEVICKYNDKEYCQYCIPLKAISVLSFTKETYIKFWTQSYTTHPKEKQIIIDACNDKLTNGTISKEKMLELVINGKDTTSDRDIMIQKLKGKPTKEGPTKKELKRRAQMEYYFGIHYRDEEE